MQCLVQMQGLLYEPTCKMSLVQPMIFLVTFMNRQFRSIAAFAPLFLSGATHAGFQDSSFEAIAVPPGNWVPRPASPHWNFIGVPNFDSGVGDGISPWGEKGNTGSQYGFIQRNAQINQRVTGLTVGRTYALQFALASRYSAALLNNPNSLRLMVDNTQFDLVRAIDGNWRTIRSATFVATATSHTIRFQGIDFGADESSLIDDVRFADLTAPRPVLLDSSFEAVNFLGAIWYHSPPLFAESPWRYSPNNSQGSAGISRFGTTWGETAADGDNFAFVQRGGSMWQDLQGLTVGQTYYVTFSQAERPIFTSHLLRVLINDTEILGPTRATRAWMSRTTATFTATSTSMRLTFAGVPSTGDGTSLIDKIQVVPEPGTLTAIAIGLGVLARRRRSRQP